MTSKPETFFTQLYKLTRLIEDGITDVQKKAEEKPDPDNDNSQALQILQDSKQDVKQLKFDAQATFTEFSLSGTNFNKVVRACQTLIESKRSQLNKIEEHLANYGYTKQVVVNDEERGEDVEVEDKDDEAKGTYIVDVADKSDDVKTPPARINKPASRTPKLEDFGISSYGMQAIYRTHQNKPAPLTNYTISDYSSVYGNGYDNIPSAFQHNGLIVTPSVIGKFQWPPHTPDSCAAAPNAKKGLFDETSSSFQSFNLNMTTDSAVAPVFRTPGMKQINKDIPIKQHNKIIQPCFTSRVNSPVPPVLQTPGITSRNNKSYYMEEPEPPELTSTFQDLTQLTNMKTTARSVNEPQAPVSLTEKFGYVAEVSTPPRLELLTSRLIKMGMMPNESLHKNETPPPPTLFGKYRFQMDRENIAP